MKNMKRIPIIDFVRFGSIFIVLGAHFFPQWIVKFIDSTLLQKIVLNVFHNGPYGVTCFFVVSGFLISEILVENKENFSEVDLQTFYVKRAARILPLLGVVVLTAFCLEHSKDMLDARVQQYRVWNDVSGFGWPFWLSLVTFNFNWYIIDKSTLEGFQWNVLWSLAVEEQFYFCYPIIVKKLQNRKKVLNFLFGVVAFALVFRFGASFYFHSNEYWMQLPSFAAFDQIAIGGILYFTNQTWGYWLESRRKTSMGLMLAGMGACFCLCYATSMHDRIQMIYVPTLMAVSCALVLLGGLHIPALFSKTAHVLSWPGKLSYGCYLWHPTIIFLLMPILVPMGGVWGFIFLVLVVSFFAFLSYRYFEVPVNYQIRAWFKLKPSSTT
jgi:peptidoglycan/LPS O-acetylase OafA/YrhL